MLNNISVLELRVSNKKGYSLCETLEVINIENSNINEATSEIGRGIQKAITLALMAVLDDASGELSGFIAVIPILYKNVYEIHQSNKKIEEVISSGSMATFFFAS